MARPLGSGPIDVYIGFGPPLAEALNGISSYPGGFPTPKGPSSALYYGTTREGPEVTEDISTYPIMNDQTGPRQSMDEGYAGRQDIISLVMTSWTQSVDNMLEAWLDPSAVTNPRGTDALSDIGTLLLSEGKSLGIWLYKRAGGKAINVAAGLPLGRYYLTCLPVGPNRPIEGNRENMRVRVFQAKRSPFAINNDKMGLFREDNAAFLTLPSATFG